MESTLKVLLVDCSTAYYRIKRYKVGDYFGPVDLGLHLTGKHDSLNIGTGLLAGSIFPGSNRLIFNGISPCWTGFFISSMGGAGMEFDNLGINLLSLVGHAPVNSILYLNREHGEEIEVEIIPINTEMIWKEGRGGIYSLLDYTFEKLSCRYQTTPRILAVGPASLATDFGAIGSAPIEGDKLTNVDTWAGRGGFGSKMLQQHGIAAIIYGGTFIMEDFRDRTVADQWFEDKYQKKLAAMDFEATAKYRFDPEFQTGGTFGVNYATLKGQMLSFNYRSIFMNESEREEMHRKLVANHYLKQFNEETIKPRHFHTCGEPCVAVCKKLHDEFKKDYEPYQAMGPLSGIFDQRAAEKLAHRADMYGFDAISAGGVVAWLMECLFEGYLLPEELATKAIPVFSPDDFDAITDSMHNAQIGADILDSIIEKRGILDLREGARKFARRIAREKGEKALNTFVYNAFGRNGWIVPNQYWTPGTLSPMAIMGKYYMYYGTDFVPPRELGHRNADRMKQELMLDNLGICRFHRAWAEGMIPEIIEKLYGFKDQFLQSISLMASRINSRNASLFWESERCFDLIHTFMKRKREVDGIDDPELVEWTARFEANNKEAALNFWYDIHKGAHELLREF